MGYKFTVLHYKNDLLNPLGLQVYGLDHFMSHWRDLVQRDLEISCAHIFEGGGKLAG